MAGFMDAMVMGWRDAQPGRLTSQPHHTTSIDSEGQPKKGSTHPHHQHDPPAEEWERDGSKSAALSSGAPSVLELGAPSSTLTMHMGPDDFEFDLELTPVEARPRVVRRIFATTYNMVRACVRACVVYCVWPGPPVSLAFLPPLIPRLQTRHTRRRYPRDLIFDYATIMIQGGSGGVLDPTQVAAWIPLNYDLYAVGLQECENVGEVMAVLQRRLGACVCGRGGLMWCAVVSNMGQADHRRLNTHRSYPTPQQKKTAASGVGYRHFATEIGDATILHGKIALLVFALAADLDSGALRRIGSQQGRVHNGLNLGIARAANKGMVGLGYRYHDQTLAFVNCHFAADKKGRSGMVKRVKVGGLWVGGLKRAQLSLLYYPSICSIDKQDAIKTLRELVLVSEDTEYDCHFQFDHTYVRKAMQGCGIN